MNSIFNFEFELYRFKNMIKEKVLQKMIGQVLKHILIIKIMDTYYVPIKWLKKIHNISNYICTWLKKDMYQWWFMID